MFLYIFKIIIKLIMMSSRFDPGSTSKTLNLFLLRFNEWSGSENLEKQNFSEKQNLWEKTLPVSFLFIHFVSKREKEALSSSKSTTLSASSSCCLIILSWEADVHESQSTTEKVWGAKSTLRRLCKTQDLISLFIL